MHINKKYVLLLTLTFLLIGCGQVGTPQLQQESSGVSHMDGQTSSTENITAEEKPVTLTIKAQVGVPFSVRSHDLGDGLYLLFYTLPDNELQVTNAAPVVAGGNPLEALDPQTGEAVPDGEELYAEVEPTKNSEWIFKADQAGSYQLVFVPENELGYFASKDYERFITIQVDVVDE